MAQWLWCCAAKHETMGFYSRLQWLYFDEVEMQRMLVCIVELLFIFNGFPGVWVIMRTLHCIRTKPLLAADESVLVTDTIMDSDHF